MADVTYKVLLDFQATGLNNLGTKEIIPKKNIAQAKKSVAEVTKGFDNLYQKSVNDEIFKNNTFQNLDPKVFNFGAKEMDSFATSTTQANASLKSMQNTFSQLMQVERMRAMGVDAKFLDTELMNIAKESKVGQKNFSAMQTQAKKMSSAFDMNAMSVMFFGMAVQKFFLGNFNAMLNTFKMLDKKGIMPLNRALTKMEAAWTFMSFAMIQAMEPVLLPFIDGLVTLVDWFANLDPEIQRVVGSVMLLVGALGALAFLFGTIKLGMGGLAGLGIGDALEAALGKGFTGAAGAVGKGALTLAIGITFFLVGVDIFKNGIDLFFKGLDKGDIGLAATGAGTALAGLVVTAFGLILVAGVAIQVATALGFISASTTVATASTAAGTTIGTSILSGITGFLGSAAAGMLLGGAVTLLVIGLAAGFALALQDALVKNADKLMLEKYGEEMYSSIKQGQAKAIDKYGSADMKIGLEYGLLDNKQTDEQVKEMFANMGKSIIEQTPTVTESLNKTMEVPTTTAIINITAASGIAGKEMMDNFSKEMLTAAPALVESVNLVFTGVGQMMFNTIHESVVAIISDVNQAIKALNKLHAAQASKGQSSLASYTGSTVNLSVNGDLTSKALLDKIAQQLKKAVPQ
jgi:hypothetical protein